MESSGIQRTSLAMDLDMEDLKGSEPLRVLGRMVVPLTEVDTVGG